ncbi:hypothetical protein [Nocardioides sp.]|uniref:hypothetical protein n=1 Tax=Nocardioides sp. TaxID=35761 RepID=UPI0027323EDF|nr:hypothetical protein [Nocardioides sp.]MDP3890297.1 hypothetical protein [Nocardioides sp.]
MRYLHLATGSAVLPRPADDGVLLVAPDERFAELRGSDRSALGALLAGTAPVADDEQAALADQVVAWGAGRLAGGPRPLPERARLTHRLGGVRDQVAARLGARLVAGEVLDDDRLLALDAEQAAEGTGGWLPVHRELGHLVAGPLLGAPSRPAHQPITWADVRFRRLAASPARPQLLELWATWRRHGDRYDLTPPAAELTEAVRRLSAWLDAGGSLERHQVLVPLDGAPVTTHPVLPVPAGLMGLTA